MNVINVHAAGLDGKSPFNEYDLRDKGMTGVDYRPCKAAANRLDSHLSRKYNREQKLTRVRFDLQSRHALVGGILIFSGDIYIPSCENCTYNVSHNGSSMCTGSRSSAIKLVLHFC